MADRSGYKTLPNGAGDADKVIVETVSSVDNYCRCWVSMWTTKPDASYNDTIDTDWRALVCFRIDLYKGGGGWWTEYGRGINVYKIVNGVVPSTPTYSYGPKYIGDDPYSSASGSQIYPSYNSPIEVTGSDLDAVWRIKPYSRNQWGEKIEVGSYADFTIKNDRMYRVFSGDSKQCYWGKSTIAVTNASIQRYSSTELYTGDPSSTSKGVFTLAGKEIYGGETVTVTGNTCAAGYTTDATFSQIINLPTSSTKEYLEYPLYYVQKQATWNTPQHCTLVVRNGEEVVSSPASVVIGDVLTYTITPELGYKVTSASPPSPIICDGVNDITIAFVVDPNGTMSIYDNGSWKKALVWVYTDGEWKMALPFTYSDGSWKQVI